MNIKLKYGKIKLINKFKEWKDSTGSKKVNSNQDLLNFIVICKVRFYMDNQLQLNKQKSHIVYIKGKPKSKLEEYGLPS